MDLCFKFKYGLEIQQLPAIKGEKKWCGRWREKTSWHQGMNDKTRFIGERFIVGIFKCVLNELLVSQGID